MDAPDMDPIAFQSKCSDLEKHIQRVLSQEIFFHADGKRWNEFVKWIKRYPPILDGSFPQVSHELSKAGECYMYAEGTACVFHSMRALDIALFVFSTEVGVANTRDQWEVIINNIELKIKSINGPHAGVDWKEKQEDYSGAALHFRYLKNAWRNHVMHARSEYEPEEAAKIWYHSSDFAMHLAERLKLKEV